MFHSVAIAFLLCLVSCLPTDTSLTFATRQAVNCPLYLPAKNYEFPHLVVPISAAAPNATLGNSFTPSVSPNDFATIFNFDIPVSRADQTCSLYFSLPFQSQLVTTSFTFWGTGTFIFAQYRNDEGATHKTTWNTQPDLSATPLTTLTQVSPGHSYKIWTGSCGKGGLLSWRMSSIDSCLWYFQDFNECAIGVYLLYG